MASVRLTRPTALVLIALARGVRHGFDLLDATELPLVLDALANGSRTAVVPVPGSAPGGGGA